MSQRRYFTKSRYKMALQCPTKLYYAERPGTYENNHLENDFLRAVANGGFQVGALARLYFPGGTEVTAQDHEVALNETARLLGAEQGVIYEAAFCFDNLFVRVDAVVKKGSRVELIEVKAKAVDPKSELFFDKRALKKGQYRILSDWKPYLYDVAFQTYVCQKSFPQWDFAPFLMLADKSATATVEGLNQKFLLLDDRGRTRVKVASGTQTGSVGAPILCKIDVRAAVKLIHSGQDGGDETRAKRAGRSFEEEVHFYAKHYERDEKVPPEPGSKCRRCEFRAPPGHLKKSGFKECWANRVKEAELDGPFVFDIARFKYSDDLIAEARPLLSHVRKEDINPKADKKAGLSQSQRQWLQVQLAQSRQRTPFIDKEGLRREIQSWKFPYHFIDFETAMAALPFSAGRKPYEQIAFQFSHHIVHSDGRVEHAGQYLHDERGVFPNFSFLRALKAELDQDEGTVFQYATHENTVLCQILEQLSRSEEADRAELIDWIKTLTCSPSSSEQTWKGERALVDLCEVLKRTYYHPLTHGSNSLKKVLPAILTEPGRVQKKYQKPIYGSAHGIRSLNFIDWTWLEYDASGNLMDPYQRLPRIFEGVDVGKLDFTLMSADTLADGGAAMTAYSKMQFSEISEVERSALRASLLKYCELDTLAMVMLYEYWADVVK